MTLIHGFLKKKFNRNKCSYLWSPNLFESMWDIYTFESASNQEHGIVVSCCHEYQCFFMLTMRLEFWMEIISRFGWAVCLALVNIVLYLLFWLLIPYNFKPVSRQDNGRYVTILSTFFVQGARPAYEATVVLGRILETISRGFKFW